HMDEPWLQVAAGWRARGAIQYVSDGLDRNRCGEECPAGIAALDSIAHVHGTLREGRVGYRGAMEPRKEAHADAEFVRVSAEQEPATQFRVALPKRHLDG